MNLLEKVLETGLKLAMASGADYTELLAVQVDEKIIRVENGRVSCHHNNGNLGLNVRILTQGRWGFASGPTGGESVVRRLTGAALAGANFAPKTQPPARLSTCFPVQAQWIGPCIVDPFAKSSGEMVEFLMAADDAMNIDGIGQRVSFLHFRREHSHYINSEGTEISQVTTLSGGGICAWALGDGEIQQRSWPDPGGSYAGQGYEYIEELNLTGNARRVAQEAVALTKAPLCPDEVTDMIISGSQLAMQIHKTCGYRAQLGTPGCFPPERAGNYWFGSPTLSISADATLPGGAGSFGYDQEGIKAQSFSVIKEGVFTNYLSGREQAASIGRFSSGAMRSSSWLNPAAPRMTNIILHPGTVSLADLNGGIERGILLDTSRNFSVDPNLEGFVAQAELGWLIEKGKITQMVRNPMYRGSNTFWSRCDAVAQTDQKYLGLMDDGLAVGHLLVPLRIRGVKVGISQ